MARSMTVGARPGYGEEALLEGNFAPSATDLTGFRRSTRLGARTEAGLAIHPLVECDDFFDALVGLLEGDVHLGLEIGSRTGTPSSCASTAPSSATENVPENISENISEVGCTSATERPSCTEGALAATTHVRSSMTELIVHFALLRIRKVLVGLVDLFEFLLGLLVSGVLVRMELNGELPEGLFDLFGSGSPLHTQYFVIIAFVSHMEPRVGPRTGIRSSRARRCQLGTDQTCL